jgi:hypothetical protein
MLRLTVARDSKAVADAKQVRWQVYREEEGMLPADAAGGELQVEALHAERRLTDLVVYSGVEPVGTLRLQLGFAANTTAGGGLGLDLESKFVLSGFDEPGTLAGEVTRFCVVRAFRGTRAAALLFSGLRRESELRGVTHWLAAANMETDSREDADIAYRLVQQRQLVSRAFGARARAVSDPAPRAQRAAYTEAQRQAARTGCLTDLKLPRTLALFAGRMGARYIGAPAYDTYFNVFALPLAVRLADLGQATARRVSVAEFSPAPEFFL